MADRQQDRHRRRQYRDSRSRSPESHRRHSHPRSHRARSPHRHQRDDPDPKLPLNARPLTKHDYEMFKPLFASYLDIQKGKILEDLSEREAKGRWKSFIGKWNHAELAEGWYDPSVLERAQEFTTGDALVSKDGSVKREPRPTIPVDHQEDQDSDDSMGPTLPGEEHHSRSSRMGPTIPSMSDIQLRRELAAEDAITRREDLQYARKLDRKQQKEALDELVPRAEAGTRERQLEKKRELNEKMRSFRDKSPGGAEVPDQDLLGDGDGAESYRKLKQEAEKKKNERELRREEVLRARAAERAERMAAYQERENRTMAMLKELAKQNFG